ncbi:glycoside hydrolase family 15 protein [Paraburkholderia fungorum]|uniref:glycoside hydrolase family 15 protein n=1 Tax=Paraburkholderia fungorum TaxID=134537 RepID=UPI0038B6B9BE
MAYPFDGPADSYSHRQGFLKGWTDAAAPPPFKPKANVTGDGDALFNLSRNVLLAHEDKTAEGALVASLSIPWGQTVWDLTAGYHMVWPRDMCQSALALLAAEAKDAPLRALMFLATSQGKDGSFPQKFFINGEPWRDGSTQLDEFSFPIILAYHLSESGLLQQFDPTGMVLAAAGALIAKGPMTAQERWEEQEGYSPSTLASNIAALVCATKWTDAETGPVSSRIRGLSRSAPRAVVRHHARLVGSGRAPALHSNLAGVRQWRFQFSRRSRTPPK